MVIAFIRNWIFITMRFLSAILWCAAFLASPALAGDWREIARTMPPDTELMLVVENAAAMRRGESGEALTRLFSTILPLTTTAEAWSVLAKQLNAPPDAAFDMLLGNQVVLLTRAREDGPFEWVFASDVDARTARKLLDSLGAKPKHIEFNQPIAIIENGRFQLTYEKRGAYATLLFAPTHSEALFIDLIKRMRQSRGASLAEAPEFKRASEAAFADANAFLFLRYDEADWLSVSARRDRNIIDLRLTASCDQGELPITPFTAAQWRAFADGQLFAVVEPLTLEDMPIGWLLTRFGVANLQQMFLPIEGRAAIAIAEPVPGELAVAAGLETTNVDVIAPIGDAVMAQFATQMAATRNPDSNNLDCNTLAGAFPDAARAIVLPDLTDDGRALPSPLGGGGLELHWSYEPLPGRDDRRGWWIIANEHEAYQATVGALSDSAPAPSAERIPVSFFSARPAQLGEALRRASILPEPTVLSRLLELIESADGATETSGSLLTGGARLVLRKDIEKSEIR